MAINITKQQLINQGMTAQAAEDLINDLGSKAYGGGMSDAELADFETLVSRLEKSKMQQAGQLNRARQRETYGKGLAGIMRNF